MRWILDTNILISHWSNCRQRARGEPTTAEAEGWGAKLIDMYSNGAIVTPAYLEFIGSARSSAELSLYEAYLGRLEIVDNCQIPSSDWEEAKRKARRVARDGKARHAIDCLIRAIAHRLKCEVRTLDAGFPR